MSAPTMAGTSGWSSAAASLSHTVPLPAASPGDLVLAIAGAAADITRPAGWSLIDQRTGSTAVNQTVAVLEVPAGGAPATTVWALSASKHLTVVFYVLGNAKATGLVVENLSGYAETDAIPVVVTSAPDCLIVTAVTGRSTAFPVEGVPAGFTAGPTSKTAATDSASSGAAAGHLVLAQPGTSPAGSWNLPGTGPHTRIAVTVAVTGADTNTPPVIDAGPSHAITYGQTATLTASATDIDGDAVAAWSWECISLDTTGVVIDSPTAATTAVHLPARHGAWTFQVTGTDARGGAGTDTAGVVVTGPTTQGAPMTQPLNRRFATEKYVQDQLDELPASGGEPHITDYNTGGSHTYTIPAGATLLEILATGGGGGGGGGSRFDSASAHSGGAGGGGGAFIRRTFAVADLGGQTQLAVVVGAAGTSGPGSTADSTNGTVGGAGGTTTVATLDGVVQLLKANGGAGGGAGSAGNGTGGAAGTGMFAGTAGGASSGTATAGNGAASLGGATGGGGGGGLSAAGAVLTPGAGGGSNVDGRAVPGSPGVNDPATGTSIKGADGVAGANAGQPGLGGRGGIATTTSQGGAGGVGGWPGAGGGGGAAALNSHNGGAGGGGGAGAVRIIAR